MTEEELLNTIAKNNHTTAEEVRKELLPVLEKFALPTAYEFDRQQLMPLILHDKKMQQNGLAVIFVPAIGTFEIRSLKPEEMEALL